MKNILFDLDNTLIDRAATVASFSIPFIEKFKTQLLTDVCVDELARSFVLLDNGGYAKHSERAKAIKNLNIWCGEPESNEVLSEFWQSWIPNNSVLMFGALDCLRELREMGFKIGLVTNGKTRNQTDKVVSSGLAEYFDTIVISDSVGVKKPDPQIFDIALSNLKGNASESLFIGDHQVNDYLGASKASLIAVWFQNDQTWQQLRVKPKYVVNKLSQVVELATSLTNHSS
jgi:putative hydrolase of the HAD superfamily